MLDTLAYQITRGVGACLFFLTLALGSSLLMAPRPAETELLHASFDSSRELLGDWHAHLAESPNFQLWGRPTLRISNTGSAAQARAVRDGLKADLVSLSFEPDWDILVEQGLVPRDWRAQLPGGEAPWHAAVVFVVRKGNPHRIRDWPDLIEKPVKVVLPNPKTAGVARAAVLTAWAYIQERSGPQAAERYLTELCSRVPVFDPSARLSTTSFAQKGIGDVQITWEPEGFLEVAESKGELELVQPSLSYRIEPALGMVRSVTDAKNTTEIAEKYLEWTFSEEAQTILAQNHFRPVHPRVQAAFATEFPPVRFFRIGEVFADWDEAKKVLFADGAAVDRALQAAARGPSATRPFAPQTGAGP